MRIQLSAIDEMVYREFQKFVLDKHGNTHGKISLELNKAMAEYMSDRPNTRTKKKRILNPCACAPKGSSLETMGRILNEATYHGHVNIFDAAALEKAIMTVVSGDPRIIRKYTRMLLNRKWLIVHKAWQQLKTFAVNPDMSHEYPFKYIDNLSLLGEVEEMKKRLSDE